MASRITLSDYEMQTLSGLLDAGIRATGLRAVHEASRLLSRIESAERMEEVAVDGQLPELAGK